MPAIYSAEAKYAPNPAQAESYAIITLLEQFEMETGSGCDLGVIFRLNTDHRQHYKLDDGGFP